MIIWLALLIPVIAILLIYFMFHTKVVWWELAIFGVVAIFIVIMKFSVEACQTRDTELLTDKAIRIEHHEKYVREWEEWVSEQGYTDSKGNYHVTVPAHWETRTEYHPEYWIKIRSNESSYSITSGEYNRIKAEWNNETYRDLYHSDQRHCWGCPDGQQCRCSDGRGDMFYSNWPRTTKTIIPITWSHSYENRIQASHSIFKFEPVSEEIAKTLYELPNPDQNHNIPAILGDGGPTQSTANKKLMQFNALIGPRPGPNKDYKKAGKLFVLIFKDKDVQSAIDQENYWQGGNKNEFTLCIGIDKEYKIKWSYIISWTKNEKLKADVIHYVNNQIDSVVDLNQIVQYMGDKCYEGFARREFTEFSYLTVDPPGWAVIVTYVISLVLSAGIGIYVVSNEFTHDNPNGC